MMKAVLLGIVTLLLTSLAVQAQGTNVVVQDGTIQLGSAQYGISFSASSGSILSILDKTTSQTVIEGENSLWTATLDNAQKIISTDPDETFTYTVNDANNQVIFTYAGKLAVIVTLDASDPSALRMQASLDNQSGRTIQKFAFPGDLLASTADIQDGLLPLMPGALINTEFFSKNMTYSEEYPGVMFADYLALRSKRGDIALYSQIGAVVQPVLLGYASASGDTAHTLMTHNYKTWVADKTPWTSPWLVIRVGQDYPATIAGYRTDNAIDQYPSLKTKLGDAAPTYFASPMYKLDLNVVGLKFAALKDAVVARLNFPGIIHFVAFQVGGHDRHYPDFIPPDPRWGTTQDFADLVSAIHSEGSLAIPYTNFSWWDTKSPTLTALPDSSGTKLFDVVVRDGTGLPDLETYTSRSGYVVDLNNAFVQNKIAEQHNALLHDVGMDGIFEDQWGVRDVPYDFNPAGLTTYDAATAYFEGVLKHYHDQAASHLFTEQGVDVLAKDGIGFMGSNELWDMLGYRTTAAYTTYYPMAGMLLRDKVLFYQHNLASQTWTKNKDILRWNLAQGYGLSNAVIDDTSSKLNMDNPWLNLIGVFQKYALANYADELVQAYDDLGSNVTRTTFATYTVYANWDANQPYTLDGATLPPGGVVTLANDGSVVAGVFSSFDGQALSDGDHYLVEVKSADALRVYQPVGADTTLHMELPSGWTKATVQVYQYDGTLISTVDASVTGSTVQFQYQASVQGQTVGYYQVSPAA